MIGAPGGEGGAGTDFFMSYTQSDRRWAEWISWVLEDAGFRVVVQAWDFGPGSHFVAEMHEATRSASRTVAVVSAAYLSSVFAAAEWQAAWVADPAGRERRLLAFRVEDCAREGLLRQLVTIDLFGVDRDTARGRLLTGVRGERLKPDAEPPFPQVRAGVAASGGEPLFPRPTAVWGVPWPRNPNFTGRAGELDALRRRLNEGSATAAVLPQALHGLGGVGKTQLAVEYAYRHATDYDLVWWLPAEQPASAVAALAELAAQVEVATLGAARESADAAVRLLRRRDRFPRWLVIADNAGTPSDLWGLLTAVGGGGHVLVTSRNPGWSQVAQTVEVDVLSRAEAVALLHARAPRLTDGEADHVAELLGDLPLALEQAGAWLAGSGMNAADYADAVEHRTREILAEGTPVGYPVPVAATWTLAVDSMDDPAAVLLLLLRMWAFLGPEPIPTDLIGPDTATACPAGLMGLARDPLARARAVAGIARLGLVRLVDQTVVMHRLVQAVLREHTPTGERNEIHTRVHRALAAAATADPTDPTGWPRYAQLYPHAVATNVVGNDDARRLVERLCNYLLSTGDYPNSLALARHAYRRWREELGEDHPNTIGAVGHLAATLRALGDYRDARTMQEDVLARCRRVLSEDHPDTIRAAANLAATLRALGDYRGARTMQEDVLARRRRVLGEDHPNTIRAAATLAEWTGESD